MEIPKLTFKDTIEMAKIAFEKVTNFKYDRFKIFNKTQQPVKPLEAFHEALIAQAARSEFVTLEDEPVRYLFVSRMRHAHLEDSLTVESVSP